MKVLFLHQNFPGQFKHLAPALVTQGHEVHALKLTRQPPTLWQGVRVHSYQPQRGSTPHIHPWVMDLETKVIRAEAVMRWATQQRDEFGFTPDVVLAHPSWGESLLIKQVWPHTKLGVFCEMYYQTQGQDVGFDPEFAHTAVDDSSRLFLKNTVNILHNDLVDAAISPTHWQASTYEPQMRQRIQVVHDGIDTAHIQPHAQACLRLGDHQWTRGDEVVTFVSRNLEPYRGYHVFMRALPTLLRQRPQAQVLIVGGDEVSYGAKPPPGQTWKHMFIDEVRGQISDGDWSRVHFLGRIPYDAFLTMLQISRVHVYLTYPFVLSWSLIEAMSSACAIVASDTPPVLEAIEDGVTGKLVPFFEPLTLAHTVADLLNNPEERALLGAQARARAVERYDLKTVCLPQQLEWVQSLLAKSP